MKTKENTTSNPFQKLTELFQTYQDSPEVVRELRMEKVMQLRGNRRYLKKLKQNKNLSDTQAVQGLIDQKHVDVKECLDGLIQNQSISQGRQFAWFHEIEGIDTDTMSVIALSVCLDAVGKQKTLASTLVDLGKAMEMEKWGRWLRERDKELERRIYNKVMRDHSSISVRKTSMKAIAAKEGHTKDVWRKDLCVKVGSLLLNAVLSTTNLFEVYEKNKYTTRGVKTSKRLGLEWVNNDSIYNGKVDPDMDMVGLVMTDDNKERLDIFNNEASWMQPMFTPMTVKPVQWRSYEDKDNVNPNDRTAGMYLDAVLGAQVPLVRGASRTQIKMINEAIENGQLDESLRALNLIQDTPFEINVSVLRAVEWAWENNKVFSKFPRSSKLDKISFPADWDQMDKASRKGWVIRAREIFHKNREIDGGLALKTQDLRTSRSLASLPTKAFYTGASWDFRGRVYPVANFSHQRGDHIKAMIQLHNKKPVGEGGLSWVALKCADLGDFNRVSKESMETRVQWVNDNLDGILRVAEDFQGTFDGDDPTQLYWSHADKPFGFLAACVELHNIATYGLEYESGFPCGLDGSNSGLQHFSALGRNSDEARLTNLLPSAKPEDLYEAVAERARQKIDACDSETYAAVRKSWQEFRVGRKTLKRNVMTKNYGSNLYGFTEQIKTDFMKPINDSITSDGHWQGHKTNPFAIEKIDQNTGECLGSDKGDTAAKYLATKSWESVNEVVKGANEGMDFIQKLCNACSKENKMMTWVTPMGFPVVNRYTKKVSKAIKVYLYDKEYGDLKRSQVTVRESTQEVDSRKAAAAVAANHTHSLDSAHLHATVLKCHDDYGIKDFFLIHDSFATNPADTAAMFNAVRQAFVDQYDHECLYQRLKDQVIEQLDHPDAAELPEVPMKGTLDLKQVLKSDYCFI